MTTTKTKASKPTAKAAAKVVTTARKSVRRSYLEALLCERIMEDVSILAGEAGDVRRLRVVLPLARKSQDKVAIWKRVCRVAKVDPGKLPNDARVSVMLEWPDVVQAHALDERIPGTLLLETSQGCYIVPEHPRDEILWGDVRPYWQCYAVPDCASVDAQDRRKIKVASFNDAHDLIMAWPSGEAAARAREVLYVRSARKLGLLDSKTALRCEWRTRGGTTQIWEGNKATGLTSTWVRRFAADFHTGRPRFFVGTAWNTEDLFEDAMQPDRSAALMLTVALVRTVDDDLPLDWSGILDRV